MGRVAAAPGKSISSVLVADSDESVVSSVLALLERAGFRGLGAATGEEALRIAYEEAPIVVLLDVHLPGLNGYQVCRALRDGLGQSLAIVLLSATRTEPVDVSLGLLLGADDYIAKPFDASELLARVLALRRRIAAPRREADENVGRLTSREIETLNLLAEGLTQQEISQRLLISPKTVATHIDHILVKLGVHSRAQAVAAAYRRELLASRR
jgi:DNA-binding NarL/FixJ family response regulator